MQFFGGELKVEIETLLCTLIRLPLIVHGPVPVSTCLPKKGQRLGVFDSDTDVLPATCCRLQSAPSLRLRRARNVAELMRPAATSWQANECTFLNPPL